MMNCFFAVVESEVIFETIKLTKSNSPGQRVVMNTVSAERADLSEHHACNRYIQPTVKANSRCK